MQDSSPQGRRKIRRRRARIPASFRTGQVEGQGKITNISRFGLFVLASDLPNPTDEIRVSLEPEGAEPLVVVGTVRWTTDQLPESKRRIRGFGVEFSDSSQAFLEMLEGLMVG